MKPITAVLFSISLLMFGCKSSPSSSNALDRTDRQAEVKAADTKPVAKKPQVERFEFYLTMNSQVYRNEKGELTDRVYEGTLGLKEVIEGGRDILAADFKVKAGEVFDYKLVTTPPLEVVEVKIQTPEKEGLPSSVNVKVTRDGQVLTTISSEITSGVMTEIFHSNRTSPGN